MLPTYQCKRCGYEWVPRVEKPGSCPKCHNKNWNTENTRNRYFFGSILVGGEMLIPWVEKKDGSPDERANSRMVNALAQHIHQTGKKFQKTSSPRGLLIKRLS